MDLGLDIQATDLTIRIVVATVCALAGITLLWLDRRPGATDSAPMLREPRLAPVVRVAAPTDALGPRLTTAAAYDRLRARIAETGNKAQRMNSCQIGAARQLDTAEVALRRLIDEISGVMPISVSPSLVPRRPVPMMAQPSVPAMAAAAA